jgi:hypothetical protein
MKVIEATRLFDGIKQRRFLDRARTGTFWIRNRDEAVYEIISTAIMPDPYKEIVVVYRSIEGGPWWSLPSLDFEKTFTLLAQKS